MPKSFDSFGDISRFFFTKGLFLLSKNKEYFFHESIMSHKKKLTATEKHKSKTTVGKYGLII
jgi:hypothetical protein